MTRNPRTIRRTAPVSAAIDALQSIDIRHLPVVDEGNNLVGMLSDRDLGSLTRTLTEHEFEHVLARLSRSRVEEVMSSDVISVEDKADARDVIGTMLEQHVGAVPVVDSDGSVVGIISYVDVLRKLAGELDRIGPQDTVQAASDRLREAHVVGRKWAEHKAAALEGTSPRDWPNDWDDSWSESLSVTPRSPPLTPDELEELLEHAREAARRRWAEIVEEERSVQESTESGW